MFVSWLVEQLTSNLNYYSNMIKSLPQNAIFFTFNKELADSPLNWLMSS